MKQDKNPVAIIHHVCPICAKVDDGDLVINMRMGDMSHVHNQKVGWELCDTCKDAIEVKKAIMLIVVDESRTTDRSDINTWYRCGHIFGVTEDYVRRVFQPEAVVQQVLKKRSAVLDINAAEDLGFDVSKYREHEKANTLPT